MTELCTWLQSNFQKSFKILHFDKISGNLAPPQSKQTLSYKISLDKIMAILVNKEIPSSEAGSERWDGDF